MRGERPAPLARGGLINRTWVVGSPPRFALQAIHPIFPREIHARIDGVTRHLASRGLTTPRLVPTAADAPFHEDEEGRVWRLLTWIPGTTLHRVEEPAVAAEAGRLVGRFHRALLDCPVSLHPLRPHVHDTPRHMARLGEALETAGGHRLEREVTELGNAILEAWERMQAEEGVPRDGAVPVRPAHGDLKISNVRFNGRGGEARALVDLDTLGQAPLTEEMGDALRSWCNRAGEEGGTARVHEPTFRAAVAGYLEEADFVTRAEFMALARGMQRIALELAARFGADARFESYFGWDPAVAPGRGEHNLIRARGQYALARDMAVRRDRLEAVLRRCWEGGR